MLKNHIADLLKENLGHEPTRSQEKLIRLLAGFISPGNDMEILMVNGYAGTGKTTLVRSVVRTLDNFKQKYMLLAPTGRAAKVLSAYTGKSAYTVHKKIYRQKTAKDGIGVFALDRNLVPNTLFVVDEASMISNQEQEMKIFGSGKLLDDLIEFVYSKEGCKLILLGDTAQLPPVGLDVSPALDSTVLASYNMTVHKGSLDDVVRQAEGSGILINATGLRQGAVKGSKKWPRFNEDDFEELMGIELYAWELTLKRAGRTDEHIKRLLKPMEDREIT
ncbi:hypothetical protein LCGC14_2440520, partial [marine sediment metagenome]